MLELLRRLACVALGYRATGVLGTLISQMGIRLSVPLKYAKEAGLRDSAQTLFKPNKFKRHMGCKDWTT